MTEQLSEIYIIEDDEESRCATELLLSVSGFKTWSFDSAESLLDSPEALNQLSTASNACVLADLRLPGMNGLQLFQWLRNAEIAVPVILISGHADNATIAQAIKAGVEKFLLKPVRPVELIETLHAVTHQDAAG